MKLSGFVFFGCFLDWVWFVVLACEVVFSSILWVEQLPIKQTTTHNEDWTDAGRTSATEFVESLTERSSTLGVHKEG